MNLSGEFWLGEGKGKGGKADSIICAKGLIQAARNWHGARCFDHSLSLSAMSLYELTLKLFKVLTAPLCELILKKD